MTFIREWRGELVNAVKNGYPVTDELMANYEGKPIQTFGLANMAMSTDSDRGAFQLLGKRTQHDAELE